MLIITCINIFRFTTVFDLWRLPLAMWVRNKKYCSFNTNIGSKEKNTSGEWVCLTTHIVLLFNYLYCTSIQPLILYFYRDTGSSISTVCVYIYIFRGLFIHVNQ